MPTQTRAGRRLLGDSACGDCMRRSVALLCYNPELMILQLRNARSGAHVAIATGRSSTAHFFSFCGIPLPRSLARRLGSAATYLQHGVRSAGAQSGREWKINLCFCPDA